MTHEPIPRMTNNGIVLRTTLLLATLFVQVFINAAPVLSQDNGGTIRGRVEVPVIVLPQYRQQPMRYGSAMAMDTHEQSTKQPPAEVTNVVVYLDGPGLDKARRSASETILSQRDATFIPHVLPIVKGTTVRIVNRDKTYHNVFSLSPAKKFNIGRRPTGEEVPVTFDKIGTVHVFCDIHSHMSAFIIVLSNPVFVQPNPDGTFTLDDVPPGKYTIRVWHERFSAPAQAVTITAGERSTVDFTLQ